MITAPNRYFARLMITAPGRCFDRLSDTLARVTYSNGTVLYVNSGEHEAEADGYRIPAMDYLAVGGENE